MTKEYDVALSFAGEDRSLVEQVAVGLRRRRVHVFYDKFEQAGLWGKDLYQHLSDLYSSRHHESSAPIPSCRFNYTHYHSYPIDENGLALLDIVRSSIPSSRPSHGSIPA